MRNQIDKIIITAMDRFVWFVLLVVMSHLVTEFTRVTGYARGNRNDVILVNDSLVNPMQVQNLVFYPGQDYGLYDQNKISANSNNNNNNNNNNYNNGPPSAAFVDGLSSFSFRPLIDSIFEIPISTLRAVNNLVARLTGSYRQPPSTTAGGAQTAQSWGFTAGAVGPNDRQKLAAQKKSLLQEVNA